MSFIIYDVVFFVLLTLAVVIFLYIKRDNLKREGLLYLYRTRFGINLIEKTSKKYAKILRPLQWLVIICGYALMAGMVWLLFSFAYDYITSPNLARALRVPVLTPIFPYVDRLFNVDFLPNLYATFWIIIIAAIAIPHEFAHGIFARLNKIKIHSTGFGFLGPFLAAFVEQDEKDMSKAGKFPQLAVLAAGTFANVIMTIIFAIIMFIFIALTFSPAGVYFNTYSTAIVNTSDISSINGISLADSSQQIQLNESLARIMTFSNNSYLAPGDLLQSSLKENSSQIIVYEDAPAINAGLAGAITNINGQPTTSYDELRNVISSQKPGDNVTISVVQNDDEAAEYNITLGEKNGEAYLGIGIIPPRTSGIRGALYWLVSSIKDPATYYTTILGSFGIWIYELLWWLVLISFSVALANMLPVGIFDGGRFFYLTVWGLTGSEKVGAWAFRISTWLILALVAAMMFKWILIFF